MESWFTGSKLPVGWAVKQGITWLQNNATGFFDAVTAVIDFLVDGLTALLSQVPVLVLTLVVAGLAYVLHRSWKLSLFVIVAFLFITNLGYWQATLETISLVGFSTIASVAIGVPLGIACLLLALHAPPLVWMAAALAMIIYAMALPERYDIACAAYAFTLMFTLAATGEHALPVLAARAWETLLGAGLGATAALVVLPLRPRQPQA